MDIFKFLVAVSLITFVISACRNDESSVSCEEGVTFGEHIAVAQGSYQDLDFYALFYAENLLDTLEDVWGDDPIEKRITFFSVDRYCLANHEINLSNIGLSTTDTTPIRFSNSGSARDYPTASMYLVDYDALIESYHLVEDVDNWLIVDAINADTTEVEGRFQLSFVTTYEHYLNEERERWDDPNRPDTLHFTNGEFKARLSNR